MPFCQRAAFERSDEWHAIMHAVEGMYIDLLEKVCDNKASLEIIRYAQGGIDLCKWVRELPELIFEEDDGSIT